MQLSAVHKAGIRFSSATTPPTSRCFRSFRNSAAWAFPSAACSQASKVTSKAPKTSAPGWTRSWPIAGTRLDEGPWAGSCRHRQRAHGCLGRSDGSDRVVVLSALRQRPDLLPIVGRQARRRDSPTSCSTTWRSYQSRICAQHRDRLHRADRSPRRQGPNHRLRAALPPVRPRVSSAADLSHHRAGRRPAAHHHPDATDQRLRQAARAALARQQPHPLFRRGHRRSA